MSKNANTKRTATSAASRKRSAHAKASAQASTKADGPSDTRHDIPTPQTNNASEKTAEKPNSTSESNALVKQSAKAGGSTTAHAPTDAHHDTPTAQVENNNNAIFDDYPTSDPPEHDWAAIIAAARIASDPKSSGTPRAVVEPEFPRDAYGSSHHWREQWMLQQDAEHIRKLGIVYEDPAEWRGKPDRPYASVTIRGVRYWYKKGPEPEPQEVMCLKEAMKIQRKKDRDLEKWLEDWQAGKIDEDGNPIDENGNKIVKDLSGKHSVNKPSGNPKGKGAANNPIEKQASANPLLEDSDSGSDLTPLEDMPPDVDFDMSDVEVLPVSQKPAPSPQKPRVAPKKVYTNKGKGKVDTVIPPNDDEVTSQHKRATTPPSAQSSSMSPLSPNPLETRSASPSVPRSPSLAKKTEANAKVMKPKATKTKAASKAPATKTPAGKTPAKAPKFTKPKAPKAPKPPVVMPPVEPGCLDYKEYHYYQLAAICRERNIHSRGGEEELRATLIRDDKAVREGTARDFVQYSRGKGKPKREYKTQAPDLSMYWGGKLIETKDDEEKGGKEEKAGESKKRKREDEEEKDGEDEGEKKAKKAKLPTPESEEGRREDGEKGAEANVNEASLPSPEHKAGKEEGGQDEGVGAGKKAKQAIVLGIKGKKTDGEGGKDESDGKEKEKKANVPRTKRKRGDGDDDEAEEVGENKGKKVKFAV
jgi:hypothetical protein